MDYEAGDVEAGRKTLEAALGYEWKATYGMTPDGKVASPGTLLYRAWIPKREAQVLEKILGANKNLAQQVYYIAQQSSLGEAEFRIPFLLVNGNFEGFTAEKTQQAIRQHIAMGVLTESVRRIEEEVRGYAAKGIEPQLNSAILLLAAKTGCHWRVYTGSEDQAVYCTANMSRQRADELREYLAKSGPIVQARVTNALLPGSSQVAFHIPMSAFRLPAFWDDICNIPEMPRMVSQAAQDTPDGLSPSDSVSNDSFIARLEQLLPYSWRLQHESEIQNKDEKRCYVAQMSSEQGHALMDNLEAAGVSGEYEISCDIHKTHGRHEAIVYIPSEAVKQDDFWRKLAVMGQPDASNAARQNHALRGVSGDEYAMFASEYDKRFADAQKNGGLRGINGGDYAKLLDQYERRFAAERGKPGPDNKSGGGGRSGP